MTSECTQRVIALVDMDCFYCQVESRLNPALKGKPVAVVQYNQWKGGGIIAVNYEAKDKGVTRGMRGAQAKQICPDINLVAVPELRGKADLTKYREAGDEVAEVFSLFSDHIQRASIDEAYIDLTKAVKERINNGIGFVEANQLKSTYVVGFSDLKSNIEEERSSGVIQWVKIINESLSDSAEFQLTVGALIVEEMREQILVKTGFHCSAGIAHNKILAKLVAGLHKPKHQTLLPQDNVPELYDLLPIYKIKSLGGKFGRHVAEKLSISYMSEMYNYTLKELQEKFDEKSGLWLYNIARGVDLEPVIPRLIPESIGCCKNFPGKNMLRTKREVKHWIGELAGEISERLYKDIKKNRRRAKLLTVSFYQKTPMSRSDNLHTYKANGIANCALELIKKFNTAPATSDDWDPPIKFLGLSTGKFSKELGSIDRFLMDKTAMSQLPTVSYLSENQSRKLTRRGEENCGSTFASNTPSLAERNTIASYLDKKKNTGDDVEKSFFLSFLNNHTNSSDQETVPGTSKDLRVLAQESNFESTLEVISVQSSDEENIQLEGTTPCSSFGVVQAESSCGTINLLAETKLCEECNQNINLLDFFEHLDYHVALRLQCEINEGVKSHVEASGYFNQIDSVKDPQNKRKRLENGKVVAKKVKDIKSFFPVVTK